MATEEMKKCKGKFKIKIKTNKIDWQNTNNRMHNTKYLTAWKYGSP